jgi:tRNA pseudouridine55 synthase
MTFDGILLLDKPQGLSSNAALQRVRRAFGRVKAGHTGSLDPLATGMLPICLGEATKVAGYLLEGDKRYRFTANFGARTATGDLEGEIVERCPVPANLQAALAAVLPQFHGEIQQIPPMYSALKQGGEPLYKLARQGLEVERAARTLHIYELQLHEVQDDQATLTVSCSKGTYVRTLAEDLARAIGSCAHLGALRREAVEPFLVQSMVTLENLETAPQAVPLLAADLALPHFAAANLTGEEARRLAQGQAVAIAAQAPGLVRCYGPGSRFVGIGAVQADSPLFARLQPVRLFNGLASELT